MKKIEKEKKISKTILQKNTQHFHYELHVQRKKKVWRVLAGFTLTVHVVSISTTKSSFSLHVIWKKIFSLSNISEMEILDLLQQFYDWEKRKSVCIQH